MCPPEAVTSINRGHRRPHSDPLRNMIVATVIVGNSAPGGVIMLRRVFGPVMSIMSIISVVAAVILPIVVIPVLVVAVAPAPGLGFHHRRQSVHANYACRRQTMDNLPYARLLN